MKLQLDQARELLHRFDIAQDIRALTEDEVWLRRNLKQHCLALASLRRTIVRLRSRIDWLSEGDADTSYFHGHAKYRKRKCFIPCLHVQDSVLTAHEDKEAAIWDYYQRLLGTAERRELTLNLEVFYQGPTDLSELDAPISEDEVWDIVKNLPSDKSPGPDRFTARFYKSCWGTIKHDVMAAIGAVHGGDSRKLHMLNSAYMVLIPKTEDATRVADFRPISLVHSFAKLITKILANRLAPRLGTLVAPNQSAFI